LVEQVAARLRRVGLDRTEEERAIVRTGAHVDGDCDVAVVRERELTHARGFLDEECGRAEHERGGDDG
jgi:hypothetical protein